MVQGVSGCDAFVGVVHEYLAKEVKELVVEAVRVWYCFLGQIVSAPRDCGVEWKGKGRGRGALTINGFIFLTYFLEVRTVSLLG